MAGIETLLTLAKSYGFFEFYLPFLLVFSMFYGLLQKANIFGPGGNRINLIIALVASFYVLIFSPLSITISSFFSTFFAETSLVVVTLLVGMMIVGLLMGFQFTKGDWEALWKRAAGGIVLVGFLLGLAIFWSSGGFQILGTAAPGLGGLASEDVILIALIAVTAIALWWMTKGEGGGGKE